VGMRNWQQYINRAASLLKPGGWLEMQEVAMPSVYGEPYEPRLRCYVPLRDALQAEGLDLDCAFHLTDYMKNAGLVDVSAVEYRWPLNSSRPEDRAIISYNALLAPAMELVVARSLKDRMPQAQVDRHARETRVMWENGAGIDGMYLPWITVVGRKPS